MVHVIFIVGCIVMSCVSPFYFSSASVIFIFMYVSLRAYCGSFCLLRSYVYDICMGVCLQVFWADITVCV